jgi:hypothetical protein
MLSDNYKNANNLNLIEVIIMPLKLLFAYNAKSGIFSTFEDYLHKVIKPATYQCKLCGLTYGNLGMKTDWKLFLDELEIPVEFLHKDEFISQYPNTKAQFPSAYLLTNGDPILFISQEEMNSLSNLDELIELVKDKIHTMHASLDHSEH